MIAQHHISRITALTGRLQDRPVQLPSSEDVLKYLAVVTVAIVLTVGCVRGMTSKGDTEHAAIRVTVQEGDTLWNYASKYGKKDKYMLRRVDEIVKMNSLQRSAAIQPGTELLIPR